MYRDIEELMAERVTWPENGRHCSVGGISKTWSSSCF